MHYTLKDHQGSLTATVHGNTVERLSYDAWGRRRNPDGFGYGNVTHTFDRGYTLHEHYDDFGLINMNGRMYDPVMSSFLSVDAFVDDPYTAQGFNRYAYCMHNPLRYTDPSGWRKQGREPTSGQPELVQQADYYPFGFTLRRDDYGSERPNRRLYGGKELQDETLAGNTLDWYDFEARMYDPLIGRFMTTDAKAEDYYDISPYAYCINNPVNAFDPDGKNPVFMALLLKGLVGAAVDASAQVSISMINGKSFKEAVDEIDFTSVGAAFATSAFVAPGMNRATKFVITASAATFDAAVDIKANGDISTIAGFYGETKNASSFAIDAAASIVPGIVVDNVSSGLSKAIEKDLASNASATLSKEAKASMRHTKDVIDNKGIPGSKNFANFSGDLINGQAKKIINSPNSISTSSNPSPMILAPKEEDEKEQSIYQMIIYRTGDY